MPADLLALVPLLLFLAWGMHQSKREARRGAGRPGLVSIENGVNMDAYTLQDREGEALPPWPGPLCRDCTEGVCDKAEHLGLTDAMARCPNCLDLACLGCDDPAETVVRR